MALENDGAQELTGDVADQLRGLVNRGVLSPGVHLGQSQLAERFSTSRAPVREALKLLVAEGLVAHDPNRGFFVAEVCSAECRELYRMRYLLESELLSTLEWPDDSKFSELNKIVEELRDILAIGDFVWWSVRHRDFHHAVFELSPAKTIVLEVKRLWILSDRYRALLPRRISPKPNRLTDEDHLLSALRQRDRKRLLKVFSDGRSRVEKMLLEILEQRRI